MSCGAIQEHLDTDGNHVTYVLFCDPKSTCAKGEKCYARSSTDPHGVTRKWCICSANKDGPGENEPQTCHIVLVTEPTKGSDKPTKRMECAGSCTEDGKECSKQPVEVAREKSESGTIVTWACSCVDKPKEEKK